MVKVETIKMVVEELNAPLDVVIKLFQIQTKLNEKHKEQKYEILTKRWLSLRLKNQIILSEIKLSIKFLVSGQLFFQTMMNLIIASPMKIKRF